MTVMRLADKVMGLLFVGCLLTMLVAATVISVRVAVRPAIVVPEKSGYQCRCVDDGTACDCLVRDCGCLKGR